MKNQLFKYLCAVIMLMLPTALFTACSSDDDEGGGANGLAEYYSTQPEEMWGSYTFRKVLNFKNGNTVIVYNDVANGRYWDSEYGNLSVSLPKHSGWYYQDGCGVSHTYTVVDNKIYITNGMILTIESGGARLVPDGSSDGYTQW